MVFVLVVVMGIGTPGQLVGCAERRDGGGRFAARTPAQAVDEVVALGVMLAAGMSVTQIAAARSVSKTTVYSWLRAAGLPTPAQLSQPLAQRLRTRMRTDGDCVVWTGGTTPQGYPCVSVGGAKQSVSHLLLAQAGHRLQRRAVVRNSCGNIRCVALPHLQIYQAADLPGLMARAGRTPIGERHWNARLNWGTVDAIRACATAATELAHRYGVSVATITPADPPGPAPQAHGSPQPESGNDDDPRRGLLTRQATGESR